MEEMIAKLVDKVGLDEAQARKVAAFIKDHATDIPKWLGAAKGMAGKLPGGLGAALGG